MKEKSICVERKAFLGSQKDHFQVCCYLPNKVPKRGKERERKVKVIIIDVRIFNVGKQKLKFNRIDNNLL